mmetsp:Transcript_11845/g.25013  ORF Transcript_11845/g.25013 Transcript_11845/m.25013 type:complete len:167 (+) Transcript_11845:147-647(+)
MPLFRRSSLLGDNGGLNSSLSRLCLGRFFAVLLFPSGRGETFVLPDILLEAVRRCMEVCVDAALDGTLPRVDLSFVKVKDASVRADRGESQSGPVPSLCDDNEGRNLDFFFSQFFLSRLLLLFRPFLTVSLSPGIGWPAYIARIRSLLEVKYLSQRNREPDVKELE